MDTLKSAFGGKENNDSSGLLSDLDESITLSRTTVRKQPKVHCEQDSAVVWGSHGSLVRERS